jgi:hypothetical protein
MMSLASQVHLDIKDIKSEVDTIRGKTNTAKAEINWVKLQIVQFLPLINMGVDAYTAFEQHKKVYESTMEDLSAGELYALTKINSNADNLKQQIHDLHDKHQTLPQMVSGSHQHWMVTMGRDTWDTTSAMDVCIHQDIPSTGPRDNCRLQPVAQSSGTVPNPSPSVFPVNQSTPHALHCLIQDASMDVKCWHGSRHPEYALDGIEELSDDNLTSLGLDDIYYDAILESHEQIMSSTPHHGERMDNCCFDDALATWAALKHSAWDHLIDTSPEG